MSAAGADVVLLDHMDDETTKQGVQIVRENAGDRVTIEASGRITLERIRTLASLGVDVISVGALTHSAPAADIALELRL